MTAIPDHMPRIAVVVPLYNGRDLIGDCLRSIDEGVEVIVVDDGSSDGAPDIVARDFPTVTLLHNEQNRGFGATCNRGLRATDAPVGVVLNSDARLRPGALAALAGALSGPAVGIAGARRVFPDGSHQTSVARFPTPTSIVTGSFLLNELFERIFPERRFPWTLGLSRREHEHDRDAEWVTGTCLAIRRDCFEATGGFDEDYHLYVEETDLCWRAWQAGWRVRYVAAAVVVHLGGGSTGDPSLHARRFLRSEARFMSRAYGPDALRRWRLARASSAVLKIPLLALPALVDRRVRDRLRWQWSALTGVLGGSWREASAAGP